MEDKEMKTKNNTKAKTNGSDQKAPEAAADFNPALAVAPVADGPTPADAVAVTGPTPISQANIQVLNMLYRSMIDAKLTVCDAAQQVEQAKARYYRQLQKMEQDSAIYLQKLQEIGKSMNLSEECRWEVNLAEGKFVPGPLPKQ